MVVELSEPPTFSAREEGKWVKVLSSALYVAASLNNFDNIYILTGTGFHSGERIILPPTLH